VNEYNTPLIVTCNISGRKQKLYHRPYIDLLITKHGSLESFLKNYTAKGAKKKEPATTPTFKVEPAAKISYNDIKPEPSSVTVVGKTIDGDVQTCTVYSNYDK
jgi:hypothetical protein